MQFIKGLNGSYRDFTVSSDAEYIYGFSSTSEVEVIEYDNLSVKHKLSLNNRPIRGFLNDDKIIVVFFVRNRTENNEDIYISILDNPI